MTARLTAGCLLVLAAMAVAPAAHATPIREPGSDSPSETHVVLLLQELHLEYALTHRRGVHHEITLVIDNPARAFL